MDFVFVHGTTQSPDGFGLLTERLAARGHRSIAVDLPVDAPDLAIADYAAIAAEQAAGLDHPVAVAHSAGGLLLPAVAQAVAARHLVWLGALVPDLVNGRSTREQIETESRQMFTADWHTWDDDVVEAAAISAYFLFHDCNLPTLRWALPTLRFFQPRAVFAERPEVVEPVAASTFVVPVDDRTVTPEWMRTAAQDRLHTTPVDVPGGHCPHVSRPELIAELLESVA